MPNVHLQLSPVCLLCAAMQDTGMFHIRPMADDDLDAVLAIENVSHSHPWQRQHFEHELSAPHSFPFVVTTGQVLIGYVCLMSLFEEAQILDIAVDPAQRGRGIAQRLMDYAISEAKERGAEVLALEVRSTNIPAITLYERCGFVRSGLRRKYYEGRDDAILMELKIR